MKNIVITLLTITMAASHTFAQSIERDVVASSGDYFEGAGISISWTLGEIATETYISADNILTQGFQQPGITLRIYVDLMAFLEGPFNGSDMNADLNGLTDFPLSQPFNTSPWNYPGTESVGAIPNPEIVDWFLVELRDATSAAAADPSTKIAQQAAFVRSDGTVVGLDGFSNLEFNNTVSDQLFVVLWHRNHLGMMSAFPLSNVGDVYTYDFTTAMGMAYLNGQKGLNGSVYGMYAGDADADGEIGQNDIDGYWAIQAGEKGYHSGDLDMNSQVNNIDKNDTWLSNYSITSQVPD